MIKLENINKTFRINRKENLNILDNLNLEVNKGDFVSIIGTSGIGKTTLLNIIGLMDKNYSGSYIFEDKDVSNFKDSELSKMRTNYTGYIFQDYKLINEFNVYENIQVSLLINDKLSTKQIDTSVRKAFEQVGLDKSLLKKKVSKLSGGEKQRVAIARAIAKNPSLIIADEPTGAIDIETKKSIMDLLKNLNKQGKTIILVTHDMDIARQARIIYRIKDKKLIDINQEVIGNQS